MADPLWLPEVVDTLVDMDLVDLDSVGPWPGDPEDADIYEPDWTQIHPNDRMADSPLDDLPIGQSAVIDEVRKRASGGFLVPPRDVLDALAWYTPIHYFGLGSAIYIRESAVFDVAVAILNRLPEPERGQPANVMGACRAAMSVLYLHEAYHHKIESLAIRFEMVERTRRYLPYSKGVFIPLIKQGSDDVLEESLACAEMYRRFKKEDLYRRGVAKVVRDATIAMLPEWFRALPPSYREAGRYLHDRTFDYAQRALMSQVHEAAVSPIRAASEWNLAPHLRRGLFDCQRITHVLVPKGEQPILPWIGHAPALPSVSSRKAIRHLEELGWKVEPGRGKGSHIRLKHVGKQSLTIPGNRESLSPVVLKSVAQALGVRLGDLAF
ncbi:type II toxin-antitoxin system HicA family toxin [Mycolicibacterium alvei]|uniref:type II toxin-antitoxin system HicA family toxin n=1 Tax=Mycolicibacterium alvei TaxID=67081 RepID=UPI0013D3C257|nr:type II toxin-antitoxin system HicA family toxin [Mycolicibacterium alvei]MCV6999871.1 type II toxin-antitoxin system HicA family toxin [Mycolicibacterium alvei]